MEAYEVSHDLDSNFIFKAQPGVDFCNKSFILTTTSPVVIDPNSTRTFIFRGSVDAILTGRNQDGTVKPATVQVEFYGPNALGGVTARTGVQSSVVNAGAGVANICM